MKTGFADPGDELQHEGDECESCRPFWESQGIAPVTMLRLGDKKTENHSIPIVICPYCDGDILEHNN